MKFACMIVLNQIHQNLYTAALTYCKSGASDLTEIC